MSRTVISVENLGKEYVIGGRDEGYDTLREMIVSVAATPFRRLQRLGGKAAPEERIWALKDVNFEVKEGEVLGIIGRNGAGKSTLLKILSRITEPTEGRVEIRGRVSSLLEVGTGFHPELTGRENIYLNGALLGMNRTEIDRKFDAIVDFSGVERFLDTPVKRYSSGMSVRLAFAVAAHLEPDILIVDEVLAVGDAGFQEKCLGKMQDVSKLGRTVLFVSHNVQTVVKLCRTVLTLTEGRASPIATDVEGQIRHYLGSQITSVCRWQGIAPNSPWIEIHCVTAEQSLDEGGVSDQVPMFNNSRPINVNISGTIDQKNPALTFGIAVFSDVGELLFWSYTTDARREEWPEFEAGPFKASVEIPARLLNAGTYRIEVVASLHHQRWLLEPGKTVVWFTITIDGGLSDSPMWHERRPGLLAPVLKWTSRDSLSNDTI